MAIDRDRGCTIRFHPSGFRVVQYKDAPGEYYSETGTVLTDRVARQAGYEVDKLAKERLRRQRRADALARIDREFQDAETDVEQLLSAPEDGLQVKHMGKGKYAILDDAGQRLTQRPLSKEEAEKLVSDLQVQPGGEDDGQTS